MKAESLATNALALDFIKVNVEVLIGTPATVKPRWDITAMKCPDPQILYLSLREVFFDHADLDEALVVAIRREANKDRTAATGLIKAQSLTEELLGNRSDEASASVLSRAQEEVEPAMFWNSDSERQIPIVQFIEDRVPFIKTREWLYDRFKEIIAADSERFISHIGVQTRPVYSIVH